jgi:Phage integrase family
MLLHAHRSKPQDETSNVGHAHLKFSRELHDADAVGPQVGKHQWPRSASPPTPPRSRPSPSPPDTLTTTSTITTSTYTTPRDTILRPRALHLPANGWGAIAVTEADIDWDEPGDPKTGNRTTPIPPRLVELLRSWIEEHAPADDQLLFRTRLGNRPSHSNWSRALKRACTNAGHHRIRVYDFRHAYATMMIKARVPLAEAVRRLGHSVETLVSTYIGAMEGDDAEANALMDVGLAGTPGLITVADAFGPV